MEPFGLQPRLAELRLLDHCLHAYDRDGNTRSDIHARLAELGCVPLEARPSSLELPWNSEERWDAASLDDQANWRILMLDDAEAGFDPDGRRIKPDGSVSRAKRTQPIPSHPRTHCHRGHDLTLPGALTGPNCRECNRLAVQRYQARKKNARSANVAQKPR